MAERWRRDFVDTFKVAVPEFGFISSPLVDRGAVYVQAANSVVKLDARSGAVVWRTLEGGATVFESGAFSSPVVATLAGVRQLVVQTRETLNGVDLDTGRVLWSQHNSSSSNASGSSPRLQNTISTITLRSSRGTCPRGVAMVPVMVEGHMSAMIEVGRASRPFRASEIARIEEVAEALAKRIVAVGWN